MTVKRITIMFIALCAVTGATVGGIASIPIAAPDIPEAVSDSTVTDAPVAGMDDPAATDSSAATTGSPTVTDGSTAASDSIGQVSDCDLLDVDGNNNTVSVNISDNATAGGDGASIQLHCGADNATTTDHDLIDINGNDNRVTLVVRAEDGAIILGDTGAANGDDRSRVVLNCGGDTLASCDAVDIDGNNNTVKLIVRSDDGRTVREFGTSA